MIEEGGFYDQIVNGTMKAGLIELIGLIVVQGQMSIRMMGYQGVDRNFRRNAEGEQGQHYAC
jgi:hypothetical protein